VALSADGNIAVVGGFAEDGGVALVFTRTGDQWVQEKKLAATGAVGKSAPSVALSADGRVVMLGASNDNGGVGAAWVFARISGYWAQDKSVVGSGAVEKPVPVDQSNTNRGAQAPTLNTRRGGASDSQELATPSAPSHAAVSFEE
jgi:hypothetical protein